MDSLRLIAPGTQLIYDISDRKLMIIKEKIVMLIQNKRKIIIISNTKLNINNLIKYLLLSKT